MFKFLLVAALVPAMAMAQIDFRACPNGAPTPNALHVWPCSADSPCILYNSKSIQITATGIVSPVDSATVTAHLTIRVAGWKVCYELPPEKADTCGYGGIAYGCPVTAGIPLWYSVTITDLKGPGTDVPVEIEVGLTGDGGVALACMRFDAYVLN